MFSIKRLKNIRLEELATFFFVSVVFYESRGKKKKRIEQGIE